MKIYLFRNKITWEGLQDFNVNLKEFKNLIKLELNFKKYLNFISSFYK